MGRIRHSRQLTILDGIGAGELARGIYAIAHPDSRGSENHAAFGAALVMLQRHGLAHRRHHRAGHVELTDDACETTVG